MDKVCKSPSRANMCPRVRAHVDEQLEKLATLHTSFGTKGKGDTQTKKQLKVVYHRRRYRVTGGAGGGQMRKVAEYLFGYLGPKKGTMG